MPIPDEDSSGRSMHGTCSTCFEAVTETASQTPSPQAWDKTLRTGQLHGGTGHKDPVFADRH